MCYRGRAVDTIHVAPELAWFDELKRGDTVIVQLCYLAPSTRNRSDCNRVSL